MSKLTDEQMLLLRREIGDTGEEAILSSVELQLAHQKADGDWSQTILVALRWIRAYYAKKVTTADTEERKCYNKDLFNHYDKLVKDAEYDVTWGGGLKVGSLDLDINWDCD